MIQELDTLHAGLVVDCLVGFSRCESFLDMVCASTTEDNDIKEGVSSETVSAVYRDTGGFTSGVETRDHLIFAIFVYSDDLAGVFSWDTTHCEASQKESRQ